MAKRKSRSSLDALGLEREIQVLRAQIKKLKASFRKIAGDKRKRNSN